MSPCSRLCPHPTSLNPTPNPAADIKAQLEAHLRRLGIPLSSALEVSTALSAARQRSQQRQGSALSRKAVLAVAGAVAMAGTSGRQLWRRA